MPVQHCRHCGAALVQRSQPDGKLRAQCSACGEIAWRNPAPVGMALIEHQGRLVLVRRAGAPLAGYWAPPAGYVEIGESVPQAVLRETREETGLEIALDGLFDVYSDPAVEVLILAWRARATGGVLRAGDDATEAALFAPQAWPPQRAPTSGLAIDHWFYGVIEDIRTRWRPTPAETPGRHP